MKAINLTITILFVLTLTIPCLCEDFFVDAVNGDDQLNSGSSVNDSWKTISHALKVVRGSSTDPGIIYIASGIYNKNLGETFPIEMRDYVQILGADRETTVLDASGAGSSVIKFENIENAKLFSLTITGGEGTTVLLDDYYLAGGGIFSIFSSFSVKDCIISGNTAQHGGGILCYNSSPVIDACLVEKNIANADQDGYYGFGGGILCYEFSLPSIKNSDFIDNKARWGGGIYCLFYCDAIMDNNTFSGNQAEYGGGICCYTSSPEIKNCLIEKNYYAMDNEGYGGDGGGIFCFDGSSPIIDNCEIRENRARWGGGIYCDDYSDPIIINCLIENNTVERKFDSGCTGGGICCYTGSSPTISGCTVRGNTALWGGGISCITNSSPRIMKCVIENNSAVKIGDLEGDGGGIFITKETSTEVSNCTITENDAELGGGICCTDNASPIITDCEIRENIARWAGGGISCSSYSSPNVSGCTITGNKAEKNVDYSYSGRGGGFYCEWYSSPEVSDCKINDNEADWQGGGINFNNNESKIKSSEFCRNRASECGGLFFRESSPVIINCLISENYADEAGGVYSFSNSRVKIYNSSISDNIASHGGATYNYVSSETELINCILWGNGIDPIQGGFTTVKYSCIEGGYSGEGNIDEPPVFSSGPWGDFYLSCIDAGQEIESPCIDAGSELPIMEFEPSHYITRVDGLFDKGRVDMGYHYYPHVQFDLGIKPLQFVYKEGDELMLNFDLFTASEEILVDIYFLMQDPDGKFYPGLDWEGLIKPLASSLALPADLDYKDESLVTFKIPERKPPVELPGTYTFYLTALKPGTLDFISNIGTVSFTVE